MASRFRLFSPVPRALSLACVVSVLVPVTGSAEPPPPPTLDFTYLYASFGPNAGTGPGASEDRFGKLTLTEETSCNPDGTSTVAYEAAGLSREAAGNEEYPGTSGYTFVLHPGPGADYAGEFTASGLVTIGPQAIDPFFGVYLGPVQTLERARFSIRSPGTTVIGTLSLPQPRREYPDEPRVYRGSCTNRFTGDPLDGAVGFFELQGGPLGQNPLDYEATITTPDGAQFVDRGTANHIVNRGLIDSADGVFGLFFVSALESPVASPG